MTRHIHPRLGYFAARLSDRRSWLRMVDQLFVATPALTPRYAGMACRRRLDRIRWARVDLDRRPVARRPEDRVSLFGLPMTDGARGVWYRATIERTHQRHAAMRARYPHASAQFLRYRERKLWGGGL